MMTDVEFFKYQAKLFLQDAKLYLADFDNPDSDFSKEPNYKAFSDDLFLYFDIDYIKRPMTLMKAQHYVAIMAGFKKWNDLIKASPDELKLARLVYDNCKTSGDIMRWEDFVSDIRMIPLSPTQLIQIAKQFFIENKSQYEGAYEKDLV